MYVFAYARPLQACIYVYVRVYFPLTAGGGPSSSPKISTQEQLDLVRKVASGKSVCCFRHVYVLVYVSMRACMYVRLCMYICVYV